MHRASTIRIFGLAIVAMALAACGDNGAEVKALVKKLQLSKPEIAAFATCNKDLGSKRPIFIDHAANTAVRMNVVPIEVCACQARTMAKLFKDDKLAGHAKFAGYVIKNKRKPVLKLGRKDVKQGVDTEKGAMQLLASLQSCANDFSSSYAAAQGSSLIEPFELPQKKAKKKEGEAEKHANKS